MSRRNIFAFIDDSDDDNPPPPPRRPEQNARNARDTSRRQEQNAQEDPLMGRDYSMFEPFEYVKLRPTPILTPPLRSRGISRVGHRRFAFQSNDGSGAFEEEVTPDDVAAERESDTRYLQAYRNAANDYYNARYAERQLALEDQRMKDQIELDRERQRSIETMNTNKDYLQYRLEVLKAKNQAEIERRRFLLEQQMRRHEAEYEERKRIAMELESKIRKDLQTKQQKHLAKDDYLSQLLDELNVMPNQLTGVNYFSGFCNSRSTLYKSYLGTILFVGYDKVIVEQVPSGLQLTGYSRKGEETVRFEKDNFVCLAHIHNVPNRKLIIVDICGTLEIPDKKESGPLYDLDGNEITKPPPKKSLLKRVFGF